MDPLLNALADPQPDWGRLLPREAFQEIILVLRGALPPPVSDDRADGARRDRAAMGGVAALAPANAAEGRLAAQFVAADAYALDCLRLARERAREPEVARKCAAQAMSMMREGKSALRVLLALQAARRAIVDNEAAADRVAWAEHRAVALMEPALAAGRAGRDRSPPPSPGRPEGGDKMEVAAGAARVVGCGPDPATNFGERRVETALRPRAPSVRAPSVRAAA